MADGDSKPNYEIKCVVCGQLPTVDVECKGDKVIHTELCGPCCFGEADCLDPEEW
jgi:hypothetical protein